MTCDLDITHLLYIYLDINSGCAFSLQSLKKEIDWERSTEERSASSEISADYRLPPDPVSPSFSGELYIYIYIHIYFQFIDYFLFSYPLFALHFYIHILYNDKSLALIRNRRQELRVADEMTIHCAKSLQVATAITRCNALCYIIIMTESRRIIRDVLPGMTTDATLKYCRCI